MSSSMTQNSREPWAWWVLVALISLLVLVLSYEFYRAQVRQLGQQQVAGLAGGLFLLLVVFVFTLYSQQRAVTLVGQLMESKRRQAEAQEALRQSEQRFRTIADFTYGWESWSDPHGKIVYVSPACERITGYRPDEFQADPGLLVAITHPADRARVAEHLAAAGEGPACQLSFRILTRAGEERWIEHVCQSVRDAQGACAGRRGSHRDITDRKCAELDLAETKQRLEAILGITHTGVDVIDAEFNLLYVDPNWQKVYGQPQGRKCYEYFMGRDQPCASCGIPRALATRQVTITEETLVRENGRVVEVHTIPMQDRSGRWVVAEFNVDISDRKAAEMALQASEHRLRAIFESHIDGMLIADASTRKFVAANPGICAMLGYTEQELLGMGVADIHPEETLPAVLAHFQAHLHAAEREVAALPVLRKDGSVIYCDLGMARIELDGQHLSIGSFRDVTARKQAEDMAQETRRRLLRSNEALEHFAYVASHDLQEPLRMVASYTQLLAQRYAGQLDERAQKYIHYAVDGAERMQRLINGLLEYSRVTRKGRPAELVSAGAVLADALNNLAAAVSESGAQVTHAELPVVLADPVQLLQLFQNLVGNALKFRGPAAPRVHVAAREAAAQWVFEVRDNGIGIEAKHHQRIFEIFQRLHTREEYPGAGIGLALCKRIVERHGGAIWLESTPGQGTTFFFALPKQAEVSA